MLRLTGALLVLVLIYQLVVQTKVSPSSILNARDEDSSNSKRTLFNIVWGCVLTTIICAWAAIHPNIPPREGPFKRTLRRLESMFWTIVAPEILPCWALNQLLAAITVRDVYNEGKGFEKKRYGNWETVKRWFSLNEIEETASPVWTVAHGHFLVMGGIHVVEPRDGSSRSTRTVSDVTSTRAPLLEETDTDTEQGHGTGPSENKPEIEQGRVTILTLQMLRKLVKDPEFEIQITEEEITDKSKGDALSKLIFTLQSTWFILQCIGRRVQGLDLTQLELTTLALASLNGITFVLWWDKPLGAQTPMHVSLKRKLTDEERLSHARVNSARTDVVTWMRELFEGRVATIRDAFLCQSKGNVFLVWFFQVPSAILVLPFVPFFAFAFVFLATLFDVVDRTSSSFPPNNTHVPTFYVPKHRYPKRYHMLLLVTLGAIFGGIHCSGWNFPFPTHTEQKLWRIASLSVTILPITTVPFILVVDPIIGRLSPVVEPLPIMILILCALAYVSARFVLLGLALSLLRHLPPSAFIAINWTKFYPHIL